jgi:hypothetical protein
MLDKNLDCYNSFGLFFDDRVCFFDDKDRPCYFLDDIKNVNFTKERVKTANKTFLLVAIVLFIVSFLWQSNTFLNKIMLYSLSAVSFLYSVLFKLYTYKIVLYQKSGDLVLIDVPVHKKEEALYITKKIKKKIKNRVSLHVVSS